jgi:hypothetical protein
MHSCAALPRLSRSFPDALSAAGGRLLVAFRLWASVCLALLIAFWLELDNPYWAVRARRPTADGKRAANPRSHSVDVRGAIPACPLFPRGAGRIVPGSGKEG